MKEIRINEFQNFSQVIEIYNKCLKIFSNEDKFNNKTLKELIDPKYGLSFAIITAVNFSQVIEYLHENNILDGNKWNEDYYKQSIPVKTPLTENFFVFSDVKVKDVQDNDKSLESFKERIHKIRNCLAHGRYHLMISDNDSDTELNRCYIEFDDPEHNVEGKILFSDMRDFSKKIKNYITANDAKYSMERTVVNDKNPKRVLSKYIEKIYKMVNNKKSFISKEEAKRLIQYFSLVGIRKAEYELHEFMNSDKRSVRNSLLKDYSNENIIKNAINYRFSSRLSDLLNCILNGEHSQFDDNLNTFLSTIYMGYGKDDEDTLDVALSEYEDKIEDYQKPMFQKILQTHKLVTKGKVREEDRRILFLKRPILYADTLMSACEYMVGYIRECNINYDRTIFKFSDIDMKNIRILKEDNEEPSIIKTTLGEIITKKKRVKEREKNVIINEISDNLKRYSKPKGIIQDFLNIAKKNGIKENDDFYIKLVELRDYENSIRAAKGNINITEAMGKLEEYMVYFNNNINELNKYPEIMKKSFLQHFIHLKQKISLIEPLGIEIKRMEEKYEQVKNEGEFTDYSGLFGHIRNSIVHSDYIVDYSLAAKTGNYEDIEFLIRDHKKGDPNWVTFECKMRAKDLINLLNSLQKSITNQVNQSDKKKKFENKILHDALVKSGISTDELQKYNINYSGIARKQNRKGEEQVEG